MAVEFPLMKAAPLLNRNLKLVGLSMASRQLVMAGMLVLRSLYLYEIGFDPFTIGLLSTIATVVGAVRSGVIGLLADKYGKKTFIILGGLFSFIRFTIYAFSKDFGMLVLAQGLGAFGEGGGSGQPTISGVIADNSSLSNRMKIFNWFAITNAVAATIGSFLAGLPKGVQNWYDVEAIASYQIFFILGAIFSVVSAIIIAPMEEVKTESREAKETKSLMPSKSLGIITKFSFVRAVGGFGFGITQTLIPLWFKLSFGVGEEVLSLVYAASRLLSIFSFFAIPSVVSAIGEMTSIAMTRAASSVLMVWMILSPNYVFAAILLVAYRISLQFTTPVRQSFITSAVDPSERSSAVGISNLSRMSLRSFAPTIGGYIMQSINTSLPFLVGPVFVTLNGALYYLLFRKVQSKG